MIMAIMMIIAIISVCVGRKFAAYNMDEHSSLLCAQTAA